MNEGYYKSLTAAQRRRLREWLERESDRADARADAWIENGLRLVLILNAGGILSLITTAGALIGNNRNLDILMPSVYSFLSGLVLAAFGVVLVAVFFNYFSKWTNDMYRRTVDNKITREEEEAQDRRMSKKHTLFQGASLLIIVVAFFTFGKGAYDGVNAIFAITVPAENHVGSG